LIKSAYNIVRKTFIQTALFLTLLIGFSSTSSAVSIENPTDTLKKGAFSVGPEVSISTREVKYSNLELKENSLQYLVRGNLGLLDWINLYGTVGAARIYDDAGFNGDLGLAYGGGLKVRFYQFEDVLTLGLSGQFFRYTSEDDNVAGVNGNYKLTWNEYDVALGASTRIDITTFYAGGLLSIVDGDLSGSNFKESHRYGVFLGGDAELLDDFRLGIEARFVSETTVSFKLSYIFGGPKKRS
jgi:hypothetical protein